MKKTTMKKSCNTNVAILQQLRVATTAIKRSIHNISAFENCFQTETFSIDAIMQNSLMQHGNKPGQRTRATKKQN